MFAAVRTIAATTIALAALSGCASTPTSAPPSATPRASAPAPAPTPTGVAVGTPFDDECVVAWPTGPVHSPDTTQVRYTCRALPSEQYLFVLAVYADPDLEVPETTDPVRVHGTVSGSVTTTEGYRMLIVDAG